MAILGSENDDCRGLPEGALPGFSADHSDMTLALKPRPGRVAALFCGIKCFKAAFAFTSSLAREGATSVRDPCGGESGWLSDVTGWHRLSSS